MIYVGCYVQELHSESTITSWPVGQRVATCKFATQRRKAASQPKTPKTEVRHGMGRDEEATDAKGGKDYTGPSIAFADMYTQDKSSFSLEQALVFFTETCRAGKPPDTTATGRKASGHAVQNSECPACDCKRVQVSSSALPPAEYDQGIRTSMLHAQTIYTIN